MSHTIDQTGHESVAAAPSVAKGPWTPLQIMGAAFLFGPVAGGLAVAVSLFRMSRRELAVPFVLLGLLLFGGGLALAACWVNMPMQLLPICAGLVMAGLYRGTFEEWKAENLTDEESKAYKKGPVLDLFTLCLPAFAAQLLIALYCFKVIG